jgi:hypothetical protein
LADGTVALWTVVEQGVAGDDRGAGHGKALAASRVGFVLESDGSTAAAFSPSGDVVVSATGTTLKAWNSTTRAPVVVGGPNAPVAKVSFSTRGGGKLATAGCGQWDLKEKRCMRGEIQFWDTAAWRPLGPSVSAHKGWLTIAFHPEGRTLVSAGSDDDRLIFWDVASRTQTDVIPVGEHRVFGATFSPDGKLLATATNRGLLLWDPDTRRQIRKPMGEDDLVVAVAFSRDGRRLAWAGRNSDISVWEVGSTSAPRIFSKHRALVESLAFSPDGHTLASGSNDRLIVLWDVASGEPRGLPLAASAPVSAVAFSPDGNTLVSGTYRGPVTLWYIGTDTLRAGACDVAGRNLTRQEWQRYFGDEPYRPTCAEGALRRADFDALNGHPDAAAEAFGDAVAVGLKEGNAYVNNAICWWGSLAGAASIVMAACERAVSEAESNPQIDPYGRAQIRDSRGVARAMHGDFAGAIDDFSFFVSHARAGAAPELFKRRESWLAMLKQDRNPFDAATLQTLRIE